MSELPTHRNEHTGNPGLDRIQGNVRSLIDFVRELAGSVAVLRNRSYVALTTSVTLAVAAYATLLTATITTLLDRGYLVISFSASAVQTTTTGIVYFQVVVDGTVAKGAFVSIVAGGAGTASMVVRVPVTKGAHTVLLQWKSSVANARINAASVVEEHAHLLVQEAA